jgi:Tfp pilus assembly protein PilF
MRKTLLLVLFAFTLFLSPVAIAGQDYFTADHSPRSYLTILEGAHVATLPGWISKGDLINAVLDIEYTLRAFPNHPRALQFAALVSQMNHKHAWAIKCFETAISSYPHYALTYAQFGLFLVSINDVDAGLEQLKKAVEIEPEFAAGYAGLAHAYTKKGDIEQARKAAKKARELGYKGNLPAGL